MALPQGPLKSDRFYWLTIAGLIFLAATNLATFYLYAQEKMKVRQAVQSVHQAVQRLQKETSEHVTSYRTEARQKFIETLDSLKANRDSTDAIKQQIAALLKERNRRIQRFYANRSAGVGEALKIIQEDGNLLGAYNQWFELAEDRHNAVVEKIKPLGGALGFQQPEELGGHDTY